MEGSPGGSAGAQRPVEAVTEAHQAPAEEARNEFVSRVSHELRTPLQTILGFGELLALSDLSDEQRQWVSMMVSAARHLATLMDDLSDISRMEARKLSLSIEPVPVQRLIGDAIELARPLAAAQGVRLDPPPAPSAPRYVRADQQRLRQVLLNLLSNAVKFNYPAGKVTLAVARVPGGRVRISVSDTGRGIAGADIGRLFIPFQRLDAAQAGIGGTGLGLALCRQLIEAMAGTIGVTSSPGEGSTFWVELPSAQPPASAPTGASARAAARAYASPKTILYVEDMVENLRLVEQVLTHRPSARVVPAMLGGVALDLAAEHHPDIIVLDLHLPDMPGEELLRRFRADPATSATPVVILSADASESLIRRLLMAGANAYLTKPLSVRSFLETIDRFAGQFPPGPPGLPGLPGLPATPPHSRPDVSEATPAATEQPDRSPGE